MHLYRTRLLETRELIAWPPVSRSQDQLRGPRAEPRNAILSTSYTELETGIDRELIRRVHPQTEGSEILSDVLGRVP